MKHSEFLHSLRKNWPLIVLVVLVDIFFFYAFSKVYIAEFQTLSIQMTKMNAFLQTNVGSFVQTQDVNALNVDFSEFDAVAKTIYWSIARVLAYLLSFWILFQGSAWLFCSRMAEHKVDVPKFVGKFVVVSLIGFAAVLGVMAGAVWLAYRSYTTALPLIGHTGIIILAMTAILVLLYGVCVGYAVPLKRWWATVKNYRVGMTYVCSLILFVVLYYGLLWLAQTAVLVALAYAIIVVLPLLVLARVYFIKKCEE